MRYTEARLAQFAEEILADIDMNTVDFGENFDGTLQEPLVLPARLPNMLLNGTSGIAVGMATNIPPHNLVELASAVSFLIDEWDGLEDITVDDLLLHIKGPDFPTGGILLAGDDLKEAYATGKGRVSVRAKATIEEGHNGRPRIIINEIPYNIAKTAIIERIVALVRADRLKQIADLRDESDRQGMRLVVELKPGSQPNKVLNQLYKYTQLQSTFGIQMLALVNGEPRTLSLKRMLTIYIDHRFDVITRRSQFELEKRRARAHILEGLIRALDSIDAIIQTIRAADDTEGARQALVTRFGLSEPQANAILDMQLRRLAALERQKLQDEFNDVMARIAYLEDLLASPSKIRALIRDDVQTLAADYGDPRRTEVRFGERTDFTEADFVREEEVGILLTRFGYIKRVPASAYRAQRRGGKGVLGMTTRDEDAVIELVSANSLDHVLFFTNRGRVYSARCYTIPEAARAAKGTLIQSFLDLPSDERVTAIVPVEDFSEVGFFVLATRLGRIKRVAMAEFESINAGGKIAIALDEGDSLNWVAPSNGDRHIILATENGQSIRFHEQRIRVLGRQAAGVNSMRLADGDAIAGMDVLREGDTHVLVVTRRGYGKRTAVEEYRVQGRYGSGIRTIARSEKTGAIVAVRCVNPRDHILIVTANSSVLRTTLESIRDVGRATVGVRLLRLGAKDSVVGMTILDASLNEEAASDEVEDFAAAELSGDGVGEFSTASEEVLDDFDSSDPAEAAGFNGVHAGIDEDAEA